MQPILRTRLSICGCVLETTDSRRGKAGLDMSIHEDATEGEAPDSRQEGGKNDDEEQEWQEDNDLGDDEDEGDYEEEYLENGDNDTDEDEVNGDDD